MAELADFRRYDAAVPGGNDFLDTGVRAPPRLQLFRHGPHRPLDPFDEMSAKTRIHPCRLPVAERRIKDSAFTHAFRPRDRIACVRAIHFGVLQIEAGGVETEQDFDVRVIQILELIDIIGCRVAGCARSSTLMRTMVWGASAVLQGRRS